MRLEVWVAFVALLQIATCTTIDVHYSEEITKTSVDIAALTNGGMVVVWAGYTDSATDNDVYGIVTTRLGVAVTGEFLVPASTAGNQMKPSVVALSNGHFVVSWVDVLVGQPNQIYMRLFNAKGEPLTHDIHVGGPIDIVKPSLFPFRSGGGFGIVHHHIAHGDVVKGTLFDHTGAKVRSFEGESGCSYPDATALDDGTFVILCSRQFEQWLTYYTNLGYKHPTVSTQVFGAQVSVDFRTMPDATCNICTRDDGHLVYAYTGPDVKLTYGTVSPTRVISAPVSKDETNEIRPRSPCTDSSSFVFVSETGPRLLHWNADTDTETLIETVTSGTSFGVVRLKSDPGSYAVVHLSPNAVTVAFLDPVAAVTSSAPETMVPATQVPEPTSLVIGSVTRGRQESPSIAVLNDGTVIVVWQTEVDSSGFAIMGQIFDSSFTAGSVPFQINTLTHGDQTHPQVSRTSSGYVVVWQTVLYTEVKVYAREWNGATWESEIHVNDGFSMKFDTMPVVAGELSGYVISWQSYGRDGSYSGIYARRLGGSNVATWLVNTETTSSQQRPAIAKLDSGFVITWESLGQQPGGTRFSIYSQRYDDSCFPVGVEVAVSSQLGYSQVQSSITAIPGGGHYVAWTSNGGRDGSGNGVFAQEFDASGLKVGPEFQVNSLTTGIQRRVSMTIVSAGYLVAAYESSVKDGRDINIVSRLFKRSGGVTTFAGKEVTINSFTPFKQFNAAIVALPWGVVVAYTSDKQDTSGTGVYCFKKEYIPITPLVLESTPTDHQLESDLALLSDGSLAIVYTTTSADESTNSVCFQIYDKFGVMSPEVVVSANARFGRITTSGDGFFYIGFDDITNHFYMISKYDNTGTPVWVDQIADNSGLDREIRSAIVASSSDVFGAIKKSAISFFSVSGMMGVNFPPVDIVADGLTTCDRPAIALLVSGDVMIVYHVFDKDGHGYGIYGALYMDDGSQLSFNHISTDHVTGDQLDPDIIGLSDGGYAVAYVSNGQVIVKKYDASEIVVPLGGQTFTVVTADGQFGYKPRLTETGSIITVAWYSADNNNAGIIGQRINAGGLYGSQFQISGGVAFDSNPTIVTRSDHLLYSSFARYDEAAQRFRIAVVAYTGNMS